MGWLANPVFYFLNLIFIFLFLTPWSDRSHPEAQLGWPATLYWFASYLIFFFKLILIFFKWDENIRALNIFPLRVLAAASQSFFLSLRIQTTFSFPIQIHTTINFFNHSLYH